jgi:hypothetical protein
VVGHRFEKLKSKWVLEMEVKWDGYEQTTFESFESLVKDTPNEVERYLVRSVIAPTCKLRETNKELTEATSILKKQE